MINQFLNTSSKVSSKQLKNLNHFWLGFTLYSLSIVFTATSYGNANFKICQGVQIIGLILMGTTIFDLIQSKFDNLYLKFIYIFYCIWLFAIILRGYGFLLDYTYLKVFLFDPWYGGMLYFTPLLLLFPRNFVFYKKIFDIIIIFGIFYIVYDILFIKDLLNADRISLESLGIVETFSDLSFASGFLLLTYSYHSKKRQVLAIGVIILALLFAIIRARRGLILMYGNMIIFSFIFYFFRSKSKLLIICFSVFIALLGAYYVNGVYKLKDSRIFGFILERGAEDTRTGVELLFYYDMKTEDWIIGRGINGEYFCPDIEPDKIYRSVIETGYLQTILKGGLLSLGLFLLIAIPAIIKGLFYSKNIFSKASGIWIFLSLINSYPSIENTFTLKYLLVWICIGICYSDEIRNLPESSMKNQFILKQHDSLEKII